ncbi:hypothetical protein PVK06_002404 [Gossypium arboreum]|uniref:Uncharacterized protein n=1 Tax=Gossypium arboreum TaxID=29729 RepID=A0ABR0R3H3_GOSAR|nr:hypothetical protein PVK06_002404 [Gossypium arboreum]
MRNIETENLQEILEELRVLCSKWIVSKQGIQTCDREYLTPLAKQRTEGSEDPEEEEDEEDPTEIKLMQSPEIPDKAETIEPATKLNMTTSMFKTQSPYPDLRDGLSKLMDIMQHM